MSPGIKLWWHIAGSALVFLLFVIRRSTRFTNIVVISLVELPGVILHEICHLIVGIIFMARPSGICLLPERNIQDGGWTLGTVGFNRITALNAVPIALAPLLLLGIAYELVIYWPTLIHSPSLLSTLGVYLALFVLSYDSIPSRQDIRIACNWKSVLLYGSIIGVVVGWKLQQ
jgi:hypothetical protein